MREGVNALGSVLEMQVLRLTLDSGSVQEKGPRISPSPKVPGGSGVSDGGRALSPASHSAMRS